MANNLDFENSIHTIGGYSFSVAGKDVPVQKVLSVISTENQELTEKTEGYFKASMLRKRGLCTEERAHELVERAKKSPEPLLKFSKKDGAARAFTIDEKAIYVNDGQFIGKGDFKHTYSGALFNLDGKPDVEIVVQKIRENPTIEHSIVNISEKEARLQSRFNHPCIVKIFGFLRHKEDRMEIYAEKCDIDLKRKNFHSNLTFSEKIKIMGNIASALSYIHALGYAHNDLKPDNILLSGLCGKLADFGLAAPHGSHLPVRNLKLRAPEQTNGDHYICTNKTDVYQFGLVLWELFRPFPVNFFNLKPMNPRDIQSRFEGWSSNQAHPLLCRLINDCLNSDPQNRPTMSEVEAHLGLLLQGDPLQDC